MKAVFSSRFLVVVIFFFPSRLLRDCFIAPCLGGGECGRVEEYIHIFVNQLEYPIKFLEQIIKVKE